MDSYCEYILKRKRTSKDTLISIGIVLAALLIINVVIPIISGLLGFLGFLMPLLIVGVIWGAYKLIVGRNIEYEYLLTGSDIDIDKIINRNGRKRVISVTREEIEVMAPIRSHHLPGLDAIDKVDVTSGDPEGKVYVLIANKDTRKAIYFEPNEKIITGLKDRNPRKVFVD